MGMSGRFGPLVAPRDQLAVPPIHRPTQRIIDPQQFPAEVQSATTSRGRTQDLEQVRTLRLKIHGRPIPAQESAQEIIIPKENTLDRIGLTGLQENQMLYTLGEVEMPRILDLGHWVTFDRD